MNGVPGPCGRFRPGPKSVRASPRGGVVALDVRPSLPRFTGSFSSPTEPLLHKSLFTQWNSIVNAVASQVWAARVLRRRASANADPGAVFRAFHRAAVGVAAEERTFGRCRRAAAPGSGSRPPAESTTNGRLAIDAARAMRDSMSTETGRRLGRSSRCRGHATWSDLTRDVEGILARITGVPGWPPRRGGPRGRSATAGHHARRERRRLRPARSAATTTHGAAHRG